MKNKKNLLSCASLILLGIASNSAIARDEYRPLGIPAGSFYIFPALETSLERDSNIFASENNEQSDTIFHIKPSVYAQSNWSRHSLYVNLEADFAQYKDFDSEDWEDYDLTAGGIIDITRFNKVEVSVSTARGHEDRSSSNDAGGIEPTIFDRDMIDLEYRHQFNRVFLNLGYLHQKYDYQDVDAIVNLQKVKLNNDDRDAVDDEFRVRVGYEFKPEMKAFVEAKMGQVDYDDKVDDTGLERSSKYNVYNMGLSLGSSQLVAGDIYLGYQEREYDDPSFEDVDGYNIGMEILWQVTPLTKIIADAGSRIIDSVTAGESGYISKSLDINVEHELLRNLILSANLSFMNNEYSGITAGNTEERDDDILGFGFGAKYSFNRNFYISGHFENKDRDSNIDGRDYERELFLLTLGMQM